MGRFNPNAYGNPYAKEAKIAVQLQQHPHQDNVDLPKTVRQQQQCGGDSIKTVKLERPVPLEDTQSGQSDLQTQRKENHPLRKQSNSLFESKHCPRDVLQQSSQNLFTAGQKPNLRISEDHTKTSTTQPSTTNHISQIPQDETPSATNRLPPKPQSIAAPTPRPSGNTSSLMQKSAAYMKEQANSSIVQDPKPPSNLNVPVKRMTVTSHSANNHLQTATPVHKQNEVITVEELLAKARGESLRKIQLSNRAKDKRATTSLHNLDLARTPIDTIKDHIVPDPEVSWSHTRPNASGSRLASTPSNNGNGVRLSGGSGDEIQDVRGRETKKQPTTKKRQSSHNQGNKTTEQPRPSPREKSSPHSVSRAALKPIELDMSSNAWGSSIASNASQASKDSVQPLHAGKAAQSKDEARSHPLLGWDGAMQPPPADWNDRPRFKNNSPEFYDDFARWTEDVSQLTFEGHDSMFAALPVNKLEDFDCHPDGISMVPQNMTINQQNAKRYGYEGEDAGEILKYSQPVNAQDFEDWGKLDVSRPENAQHGHETTEELVANWNRHMEQRRKSVDAQFAILSQSNRELLDYRGAPNPNRPILNVYLRPACRADLGQMTAIYNWYIANSPRPAETFPIDEDDMEERLENTQSAKLPFIVAVERNQASAIPFDHMAEAEAIRNDHHPIKNIDRTQKGLMAQERIVGWASASDFTASDYVERISVELEVFIDPAARQLGVGRCLMDKLLESCDRGYMKRGGYPFHCPQEYRHLYNTGGGRDLHKLTIILRKWKYPKDNTARPVAHRHPKANPKRKTDDVENDYDLWIKNWLESWDFEVEGILKGAGAKLGRFVDVVYFGRETKWQPAEGKIPDPMPPRY